MRRAHIVVALLIGLVAVCWSKPAQAQRYSIDRPTFSPYLRLLSRGPGPLGYYPGHLRPRPEVQRFLTGQAARVRQQEARISTLVDRLTTIEQAAGIRPTGTGSMFMNYSHYYTGVGAGGAGRAPRASTRAYSPPPARGYSGGYY